MWEMSELHIVFCRVPNLW